MSGPRNPWKTLSSDRRYANRWIEVTHHEVLNPAGNPGIYGTIHFKNIAIGVIPVDAEGRTWLVGQYRYPLRRYSWEIPEGGGPIGEDPVAAARRELLEETGLRAAQLREILRMDLSNSVTDEHGVCYLAWDLAQGDAEPEETEQLSLRRLPVAEAIAMAQRGEILDSLSVAGLVQVGLLAHQGRLPGDLGRLVLGR